MLVNCTFFSKNPDLSMEEEEEEFKNRQILQGQYIGSAVAQW